MKWLVWLALSLALLSSLVGCSSSPVALRGQTLNSDHLKLNDILYGAIIQPAMSADDHDLSPYDTVQRKNRNVYRNGDAEGLEPGTPVYTLDDYDPAFRLAVKQGVELVIYQVQSNPRALKGNDLLDIGGRVKRIGIRLWGDSTEIASITEPAQIDELVGMILEAPCSSTVLMNSGTQTVWLAFDLMDGTAISQFYWLDSGVLGSFIQLPQQFSAVIGTVIAAQRQSS